MHRFYELPSQKKNRMPQKIIVCLCMEASSKLNRQHIESLKTAHFSYANWDVFAFISCVCALASQVKWRSRRERILGFPEMTALAGVECECAPHKFVFLGV